jgi:hypothetical protein
VKYSKGLLIIFAETTYDWTGGIYKNEEESAIL